MLARHIEQADLDPRRRAVRRLGYRVDGPEPPGADPRLQVAVAVLELQFANAGEGMDRIGQINENSEERLDDGLLDGIDQFGGKVAAHPRRLPCCATLDMTPCLIAGYACAISIWLPSEMRAWSISSRSSTMIRPPPPPPILSFATTCPAPPRGSSSGPFSPTRYVRPGRTGPPAARAPPNLKLSAPPKKSVLPPGIKPPSALTSGPMIARWIAMRSRSAMMLAATFLKAEPIFSVPVITPTSAS